MFFEHAPRFGVNCKLHHGQKYSERCVFWGVFSISNRTRIAFSLGVYRDCVSMGSAEPMDFKKRLLEPMDFEWLHYIICSWNPCILRIYQSGTCGTHELEFLTQSLLGDWNFYNLSFVIIREPLYTQYCFLRNAFIRNSTQLFGRPKEPVLKFWKIRNKMGK